MHTLSQEATALYEAARDRLVRFINARSRHEIIFVRGTTEAINLVAQSYARPLLQPGDEILITHLEHHANIVPWQMVCEQTGAKLGGRAHRCARRGARRRGRGADESAHALARLRACIECARARCCRSGA